MAESQPKEHRPPIVVVMGHIDHGKTTLLDAIRKTSVAAKESGGITQAIGAYQVTHQGGAITFLDTPGHEAFSAIRSRGARVADVAVLVVAADEGVKPQTKEALGLITKERLPYLVAINKIDKAEANPNKVRGELGEAGVLLEGWGGRIPEVLVSALGGQGLTELLDTILVLAETEALNDIINEPAQGVVIESSLDRRRGPAATLLTQKGVVIKNAALAAGQAFGKIRVMEDAAGRSVEEAGPSFPVRVIGFKEAPAAGDAFRAYPSLKEAERAAAEYRERAKPVQLVTTLISGKREYVLPIVVRADLQGSSEAIVQALKALPIERVAIEILRLAVGNITDADLKVAEPHHAAVIGFRVSAEPQAERLSQERKIPIRTFNVIYELVEFVRKKMAQTLPPIVSREELGAVTILALFAKTATGRIVGGKTTKGKIRRGAFAEIARTGKIIGRAKITQLKQEKIDVEEVSEGRECGILLESAADAAVGDLLNVFEETTKAQEL